MLEYSKNYSKTTGSFWDYYRDEPNSGVGGGNDNINYSIKDSKSFDYITSRKTKTSELLLINISKLRNLS